MLKISHGYLGISREFGVLIQRAGFPGRGRLHPGNRVIRDQEKKAKVQVNS
jgi:hypothetical protein